MGAAVRAAEKAVSGGGNVNEVAVNQVDCPFVLLILYALILQYEDLRK